MNFLLPSFRTSFNRTNGCNAECLKNSKVICWCSGQFGGHVTSKQTNWHWLDRFETLHEMDNSITLTTIGGQHLTLAVYCQAALISELFK